MAANQKQPTLAEIAKKVGVSPATVSRVLNHTTKVSDDIAQRVEEALTAAGYRQIKTSNGKKSGVIGVLVGEGPNEFYWSVLQGILNEANKSSITLLLFQVAESEEQRMRVMAMLEKHDLDGVISIAVHISNEEFIALQERTRLPVVLINRLIDHPGIISVMMDFEKAVRNTIDYLLSLNHKRIGFLNAPPTYRSAQPRLNIMLKMLSERGLPFKQEWCMVSLPTLEGGYQAMNAMLNSPVGRELTAIVTYNDQMAVGAMAAIRENGLEVPKDISIIGFDDISTAAYLNPPLTTVAQPRFRAGQVAIQVLHQLYHEDMQLSQGALTLEGTLMVRGSVRAGRDE